jgi:hypothetical protein
MATAGRLGFDSRQRKIFLIPIASRPALRPTETLIKLVPCGLFPGVKRPGPESVYSSPSSAEFNNAGDIPPFRYMSSLPSS